MKIYPRDVGDIVTIGSLRQSKAVWQMIRTSDTPRTATILFDPVVLASDRGLTDQMAEWLSEAILPERLSLGPEVSELRAAEELGISRAPVREVAHILAARGLLVSAP